MNALAGGYAMSYLISLVVLVALLFSSFPGINHIQVAGDLKNPVEYKPVMGYPRPPVSPEISFNSLPVLGEVTDMTFTVNVETFDLGMIGENENGLVNARAYVEFYWTDIHGSYSEASSSEFPLPL
jgi:hypothetical protein